MGSIGVLARALPSVQVTWHLQAVPGTPSVPGIGAPGQAAPTPPSTRLARPLSSGTLPPTSTGRDLGWLVPPPGCHLLALVWASMVLRTQGAWQEAGTSVTPPPLGPGVVPRASTEHWQCYLGLSLLLFPLPSSPEGMFH